jgi:uncharacterized membrane protein
MMLSEAGQARVRGYLYVLERSLRTFQSVEAARDATREVESHIRDRVEEAPAEPDERTALEGILARLGTPTRVARAYSTELAVDEAVATGRLGAVARAVGQLAATGVTGFLGAFGLFSGYAIGLGFVAVAVLKPIFPANVGFIWRNGVPMALGAHFNLPPGTEVRGGYWVMLFALAAGMLVLVLTHRAARRFLAWWRSRRSGAFPFDGHGTGRPRPGA